MRCLNCQKDIGENIGLCDTCRLHRHQKVVVPEFERRRLTFEELFPVEFRTRAIQALLVMIAMLMVLRSSGCSFHLMSPFNLPDGITVPEEPIQGALPNNIAAWRKNDFVITPLATFSIRARVLDTGFYSIGLQSKISPYDLTLGWGIMSDTAALKKIEFTHFYRYVAWSSDKPPYPWPEINAHISNLHAIPANNEVESILGEVAIDDIVTMQGYLVEARMSDGSGWGSSLTRTDTGGGACETMWIEKIEVQRNSATWY